MKVRELLIYVCAAISLVFLLGGYFSYRTRPIQVYQPTPVYSIRGRSVGKDFQVWVGGPGYISNDNVMEIICQVPGRIRYIAPAGQMLEKGDTILLLTPSDGRDVESARLNSGFKTDELENQENASRAAARKTPGVHDVDEYVNRVSSVRRAKVEASKARAEYEACQAMFVVTADHKGYMTIPDLSAGSYVSQGTKICKFVRLPTGNVLVDVTLAQTESTQVQVDQAAIFSIDTPSGKMMLDGKVIGVEKMRDKTSFGVKARIMIEGLSEQDLEHCLPGRDGHVSILVKSVSCMFVEEAAICEEFFGTPVVTKITPTSGNRGFVKLVPVTLLGYYYGYALIQANPKDLVPGDMVSIDHILETAAIQDMRNDGSTSRPGVPVQIAERKGSSADYASKKIRIASGITAEDIETDQSQDNEFTNEEGSRGKA